MSSRHFAGGSRSIGSRPHAPPRVNLGGDDDGSGSEAEKEPDKDLTDFINAQNKSSKPLDPDAERAKLARFHQGGVVKKSRYEREKEDAERRRKEEEESAARAYAEFVQAMGADERRGKDKSNNNLKGFVSAGGKGTYQPSRPLPAANVPPTGPKAASNSASGNLRKGAISAFGEDDDEPQIEKPRKEPPGKRKRAMDDFLGELQRDQAKREERLRAKVGDGVSISSLIALEGQKPGSRDLGDPLTTNLCILNLPANVNEDILGEFFCQWGDVGMVKIMWPRGEEAFGGAGGGITNLRKDRSAGLTGFVAYMRREDAEYALKETDGVRWGDTLIKTGWGKAMPLPSRPTFYMPAKSRKDTHKEVSPSSRHRSSSPALIRHRRRKGDDRSPSPRTVIRSQIEKDETQAKFISTVAARIKEHGQRFEEMIMEREKDNEKFAFLRDENLPDHQYFKMCLNDRYEPMIEPKPFQDAGYDSLYSTDSEEESEAEKMRKLRKVDQIGRVARRRFEAMLRGMTPRRERIAKCMAFAIEHAYAAEAIAEILCRSVTLAETPIPRKLARLHTISDILHNSAAPVPNAWKYRQAFERRLLAVFKHLGEVIGSFPGRMKAEAFKMQVNAVLECWENWLVLTPSHLEDLAKALRSGAAVSRLPPPPPPPPTAPAAGTSSEKVEAALVVEEKNQTTTNNNKNSLSAEEAGGQAKEGEEDLDGEALVLEDDPGQGGGVGEEEEDLDGVAMFDDDLDGKAMQ